MKPVFLAVLGTLALAAPGCVGEFTTGGPPSDVNPNPNPNPNPGTSADAGVDPLPTGDEATARSLFEANVAPILLATCGSAGCHGSVDPAFVPANPVEAYDTVLGYRDRLYPNYLSTGSKLLQNGSLAGAHKGAVFVEDDVNAISAWLAQEKLDVDAGGGNNAVSALAKFSGCMTLANFEASNMGDEWADKGSGDGDCDACHRLGAEGFMASNDDVDMFGYISGETLKSAQFMPSYFTLDASGTKVVINRARLEKVANRISPHENHPNFNLEGDAMDALQKFYDDTVLLDIAGQCGPPRF